MATNKNKTTRKNQHIGIVKNDKWLEPYEEAIKGRHDHALWKLNDLTNNGKQTLSDFASGYLYFGLHKTNNGWVFREWAPNATEIYVIGDFNNWKESTKYKMKKINNGNWEIKLSKNAMKHGQLYKLSVHWENGQGERIPAWANRVVQDENTKIFSAQVWAPEADYVWNKKKFKPDTSPLMIYECHIGMGQDEEKVGTYTEFKNNILPRVIKDGYNCLQIMAIAEHPYYGSFGYHVSNFFAPSSRFGTPEELKELVDEELEDYVTEFYEYKHEIMDLFDIEEYDDAVKYIHELKSRSNEYPETLRKYMHDEFFPHYSNFILYKHKDFEGKIPMTNNISEQKIRYCATKYEKNKFRTPLGFFNHVVARVNNQIKIKKSSLT